MMDEFAAVHVLSLPTGFSETNFDKEHTEMKLCKHCDS